MYNFKYWSEFYKMTAHIKVPDTLFTLFFKCCENGSDPYLADSYACFNHGYDGLHCQCVVVRIGSSTASYVRNLNLLWNSQDSDLLLISAEIATNITHQLKLSNSKTCRKRRFLSFIVKLLTEIFVSVTWSSI